jgi:PTS system nitrogen regulatory IIA component
MQSLYDLFSRERVVFLGRISKKSALETMVAAITGDRQSRRFQDYLDAVIDRENTLSTGIGMGFALPHGSVAGEKGFHLSLGISIEGIKDYGTLDNQPVHIIVCIVGPDTRQNEYIRILAGVTRFLKAEKERLLACCKPEEVISIISNYK